MGGVIRTVIFVPMMMSDPVQKRKSMINFSVVHVFTYRFRASAVAFSAFDISSGKTSKVRTFLMVTMLFHTCLPVYLSEALNDNLK